MRVLVTRPEPGASATAARLQALGHDTVALPLTATTALGTKNLPDLTEFGAVAVTSASAVLHAGPTLIAALLDKRCFAVGAATADACGRAGFRDVASADGDGAALAALVAEEAGAEAGVVYLCGRFRRPDFETALAKAGVPVLPVETYDTMRLRHEAATVLDVLGRRPVDAALLYSQTGAKAFSDLAAVPEVAPLLAHAKLLCLSRRVAQALGQGAAGSTMVSQEPNETALISLLAPHPSGKTFS